MESNKIQSALEYWRSRLSQDFGFYLLKETPYQPDSDFIQSLCETKEEHENPIEAGIYNDILPADVARYQAATLYKPYKES